jgi:hypothetical protein
VKKLAINDHMPGTSSPAMGFTATTAGVYDKLEAESAPAIDSSKTLSLKGTYTDSTLVSYNFALSTTHRWEYEFKTDTAMTLDEGKVLNILVSIDLSKFFTGVDFSKLTLNAENVAVIDENNNSEALRIIMRNLHSITGMKDRGHGRHKGH